MKYYTIESVVKNGQPSHGIFERENIDVARKEYHNTLAYNIGLEGVEKVSAAILDEDFNLLMKEVWRAPEPTPESNVEELLESE